MNNYFHYNPIIIFRYFMFGPNSSPTPGIQFTFIYYKENLQILTFKKLEPGECFAFYQLQMNFLLIS